MTPAQRKRQRQEIAVGYLAGATLAAVIAFSVGYQKGQRDCPFHVTEGTPMLRESGLPEAIARRLP